VLAQPARGLGPCIDPTSKFSKPNFFSVKRPRRNLGEGKHIWRLTRPVRADLQPNLHKLHQLEMISGEVPDLRPRNFVVLARILGESYAQTMALCKDGLNQHLI